MVFLVQESYFILFLFFISCQVLQRKTEEASMATKRLKDVLESRKASSRETSGQEIYYIMQFTPPPFSPQHVDYNLLTSKLLCAGAGNGSGPGIQVFMMYKEYFKKEKK